MEQSNFATSRQKRYGTAILIAQGNIWSRHRHKKPGLELVWKLREGMGLHISWWIGETLERLDFRWLLPFLDRDAISGWQVTQHLCIAAGPLNGCVYRCLGGSQSEEHFFCVLR